MTKTRRPAPQQDPPKDPASTAKIPVWRQIRDTLLRDISERRYQPGARLPTEAVLSDRFGVNRHTVRRALKALAEEGMVTPRRGAGVFVSQHVVPYPLGPRSRFTENLAAQGLAGSRRIHRMETIGAGQQEAASLGISVGDPVHVVESTRTADGVPLVTGLSCFPASILPGFLRLIEELSSSTEALKQIGITDYRRRDTRITAVLANALQARHLNVADGAPLLHSVFVNVDEAGRPIEYGDAWFAADRVEFVIDADSPA